ncbi:MAG: phospholipid carrier-dependent glycosyltransferase [Anaerolineae bacterium]|nr:phospholipid carrier-dependent glycosyltransferase [Anaerolineae bacterium]
MKSWQEKVLLVIILLTAVSLRLTGIDWDDYQHYHPDERYITWVATTIEFPADWRTALTPPQSTFNPFYWPPDAASEGIVVRQDEHRDFAYGHVPLYLGVAATRLMERVGPALIGFFPADWLFTRDLLNGMGAIEFRHLTAVSRALTALFDTATILLVCLLGKRLYNTPVGLLAAAFLAVNVMHIQLAHFFISDPYLTFFVVAALFFMVSGVRWQVASEENTDNGTRVTHHASHITSHRLRIYLLLAAICVGLAVGSKFTAVLLLLPLALTVYVTSGDKWVRGLVTAVCVTALTFFLTNPFAVLGLTCSVVTSASSIGPFTIPALDWRSCYLQDIVTQGAMVRGSSDIAFARQYSGTWAYLYFVEMQLRWGMGPLLGLAASAGLVWEIWRVAKNWQQPLTISATNLNLQSPISNFLLLSWIIPYFLLTGSFHVKFMRYLQPITPFLMLYAAALLLSIRWRWVRWGAVTAVLLTTTLYALSFVNMYRQPHPWLAGSAWVYENIPPGALILSEQWDDALPSTMLLDGVPRLRSEYRNEELTWLTGADEADDEAKLERNLARLAAGDYLTIMSNRVYGVAPRLNGRYPLSGQYHQLLFDGSLGYEPVYVTTRMPTLFGIRLYADRFSWPGLTPPDEVETLLVAHPTLNLGRADESFTVYDQPLLIIFQNTGHLTAEEMRELFTP